MVVGNFRILFHEYMIMKMNTEEIKTIFFCMWPCQQGLEYADCIFF